MPLPAILAAVLPTLVGKIPCSSRCRTPRATSARERAIQLAADVAVQAVRGSEPGGGSRGHRADPEQQPRRAPRCACAGPTSWNWQRLAAAASLVRVLLMRQPQAAGTSCTARRSGALPLIAIVIMIVRCRRRAVGTPFTEDVRSAIANGIPMLILWRLDRVLLRADHQPEPGGLTALRGFLRRFQERRPVFHGCRHRCIMGVCSPLSRAVCLLNLLITSAQKRKGPPQV